jgi:LacI family transcriptional regulator
MSAIASIESVYNKQPDRSTMDNKTASADRRNVAGRPTLKTIASITGLGITTVSRALKDAPDIGENTKRRVREVAEDIGYTPNRAGVGLRTGKTNVISLVLSLDEEVMGLTSHMVRGLSEALSTTPYHLTITPYALDASPLDAVRYIAENKTADGIILSRIEPLDERVSYLYKRRIPFATHGRTLHNFEHPYHDFDNAKFAIDAVEHLAAKGRRRVAMLSPPDSLTYYHHAQQGFNKAMQANQLTAAPLFDCTTDDSLDTIEAVTHKLFQQPDRPDAVISTSGGSTIALCAGIEAAGLVIGKDVDIVSKQNVGVLQKIRSDIITMDEDIHHAGHELARFVIRSIDSAPTRELQSVAYPAAPVFTKGS